MVSADGNEIADAFGFDGLTFGRTQRKAGTLSLFEKTLSVSGS